MEKSVVYIRRSETIKNVRMKIVDYLLNKGVRPHAIRINKDEFYFTEMTETSQLSDYCSELNQRFQGQIEFREKFPERTSYQ